MLIAADIGNTSITFGVFNEKLELINKFSISSSYERTTDEIFLLINSFLFNSNLNNSINCSVISSIYPDRFDSVYNALFTLCNKKPFVIGSGTKTGFAIRTDSAKEVGTDIICNIAASNYLYSNPAIVIDLGTVNTYSVINENSEFTGTIIAPGITTSHDSLISSAAQLYDVKFSKPTTLVGKNTVDSIISGSYYSAIFSIDGFIDNIIIELFKNSNISIIGTGINANLVLPYCKHNVIINEDLTLFGEAVLFKLNSKIF